MRRLEGQELAALGQHFLHLGQRGAGTHGDDEFARFVADDALQRPGIEHLALQGLTVKILAAAAAQA